MVRNILLWAAVLVMHLHAMLPHEHCFHPFASENHFFETPAPGSQQGVFDFLKRVFSFDIGENHLDNFKNNSSSQSFQIALSFIIPQVTPAAEIIVQYSAKITIPIHERLPQFSLTDAHGFRGPPALG